MINMNTWNKLKERLNKNQTIDRSLQQEITKEKNCMRQVFFRILCAIKYLDTHNSPFRGSNDKLYQDRNSNFWDS